MYGSPNPDTIYRSALIDDSGQVFDYRSKGFGSGCDDHALWCADPEAVMKTFAPFDLAELAWTDDGTFDVTVESGSVPKIHETGGVSKRACDR
jgi:glutamine cyclotransferase